eukprot:TRINITY_DN4927_c0_g1_i1.p1 TRINITY_DN4927_c0_g1~~TRINITY_DN4927_c0_g1_i1.p1  ORF type:complete len:337 (+),score=73.48 TRINITY_DN4927_c0_g1_i1:70-1080(+)
MMPNIHVPNFSKFNLCGVETCCTYVEDGANLDEGISRLSQLRVSPGLCTHAEDCCSFAEDTVVLKSFPATARPARPNATPKPFNCEDHIVDEDIECEAGPSGPRPPSIPCPSGTVGHLLARRGPCMTDPGSVARSPTFKQMPADFLEPAEVRRLRAIFELFESGQKGLVRTRQLKQLLVAADAWHSTTCEELDDEDDDAPSALRTQPTEADVEAMLRVADRHGTGFMSFTGFLELMTSFEIQRRQQDSREAPSMASASTSEGSEDAHRITEARMSVEEVRAYVLSVICPGDEPPTAQEHAFVQQIVRDLDSDGDGWINFHAFMELCDNMPQMDSEE